MDTGRVILIAATASLITFWCGYAFGYNIGIIRTIAAVTDTLCEKDQRLSICEK